jgi:hypothetical protein
VFCEQMTFGHLAEAMHRVLDVLGGKPRGWRTDRMATVVIAGTDRLTVDAANAATIRSSSRRPPSAAARRDHEQRQLLVVSLPDGIAVWRLVAQIERVCAAAGLPAAGGAARKEQRKPSAQRLLVAWKAVANAETVSGNAARLGRSVHLCLCKTPGQDRLAALPLLVPSERLVGVRGDDRIQAEAALIMRQAAAAPSLRGSRLEVVVSVHGDCR